MFFARVSHLSIEASVTALVLRRETCLCLYLCKVYTGIFFSIDCLRTTLRLKTNRMFMFRHRLTRCGCTCVLYIFVLSCHCHRVQKEKQKTYLNRRRFSNNFASYVDIFPFSIGKSSVASKESIASGEPFSSPTKKLGRVAVCCSDSPPSMV